MRLHVRFCQLSCHLTSRRVRLLHHRAGCEFSADYNKTVSTPSMRGRGNSQGDSNHDDNPECEYFDGATPDGKEAG